LLGGEYERTINRLIIINQEGVLPMRSHGHSKKQEPPSHLLEVLNDICNDERNTCFILSS